VLESVVETVEGEHSGVGDEAVAEGDRQADLATYDGGGDR
jgi:hypothetical protein